MITMLSSDSLLKSLPGSVYWKDLNSVYLGCNEYMAKIAGLSSPEAVVGKTDYDLSWSKEADALREIDQEVIKTGKEITIEETGRLITGQLAIYLTTKKPLLDDLGQIVGVFGLSVDITHHKKKEQVLKEVSRQVNIDTERNFLEKLSQEVMGKNTVKKTKSLVRHIKAIRSYLESIIACMPGNVYWMDRNCIYLGCNDNAAKLIGLKSRFEVIGKTYKDFAKSANWGNQSESFKRDDMQVMSTGVAKLNVEEPPLPGPNGEMVYFLTSRVPLRDESGDVIGVVGISTDITELKKMQHALNEKNKQIEQLYKSKDEGEQNFLETLSRDVMGINTFKKAKSLEEHVSAIRLYLENIIACMPGIVYWKDRDGIYRGCNDAALKMLGMTSRDELIGKTDYDFAKKLGWNSEVADFLRQVDMEVMTTGMPRLNYEELPFTTANGEIMQQLSSKVPLRDKDGSIVGVVGISIDITDKKRAEILTKEKDRIEEKMRAMQTLAASIAHELRTPLRSISSAAGGMRLHFPKLLEGYRLAKENKLPVQRIDPSHYEGLLFACESVESEARGAFTMIDMLLTNLDKTTKSAAAAMELKKSFIHDCVEEALRRYPFDIAERELVGLENFHDFVFMGDQVLVVHILFNLLKNALYQIRAASKGNISIWTEQGADYNELHFKDTAKGISPDVLPHIFDHFFSKTYHGTGIGLAFSKLMMDNMGGQICCKSEEGEYAEFVLYFAKA